MRGKNASIVLEIQLDENSGEVEKGKLESPIVYKTLVGIQQH